MVHVRVICWSLLATCVFVPPAQAGGTPAEWLPPDVKGYVSIEDVGRLKADWNRIQLGQLLADPALRPFVDQVWQRIRSDLSETYVALALDWQALDQLTDHQLAVAVREPQGENSHAIIVLAQIDNGSEIQSVHEQIERHWRARQAARTTLQVGPATVVHFTIPTVNAHPDHQHAYYTRVAGWWMASDDLGTLEHVVRRLEGEALPSLANQPGYQETQQATALEGGSLAPHVRWYIEPFGYARIVRATTRRERPRGADLLKIIEQQGFGDIQAIGGQVALNAGPYQILHRTLVYMPGPKRLAARILDFPTGPVLSPPSWVPATVANYVAFRWNLGQNFAHLGSLVDALTNEGFFEEFLTNLERDPKGPQVNVRRELIGQLGDHVVFVSGCMHPIAPNSERFAVGIELKEESIVAAAIQKMFQNDRATIRHERNGLVLWQLTSTANEPELELTVQVDTTPGFGFGTPREEEVVREEVPSLPDTAVAVAGGRLWIASDVDYIEMLVRQSDRSALAEDPDYRRVAEALERLGAGDESLRVFSRSDETYHATYELLRQGRMPESQSMLGKLLNYLKTPEGQTRRAQELDGSSLPPFEQVRRYLGPAGVYSRQHESGWTITGCLLEAR